MSEAPSESFIGRHVLELPTPSLVLEKDVLLRNIERTQGLADRAGKALRPHVKSHKMTEVARAQLAEGAVGLTCSKVSEAEWLVGQGFRDILIAYPIADAGRAERVKRLSQVARISVIIDDIQSGELLARHFSAQAPLDAFIKVDTGLQRVGAPPENVAALARSLAALPGLSVIGVLMHEGLTYGIPDRQERTNRLFAEAAMLQAAAKDVEAVSAAETVALSAGSTPGFLASLEVAGLDELRPGNYVFNDAVQVGLGVADPVECSLTVHTTVVGGLHADRFVIDAGSKAVGLDRGAHGVTVTDGYGLFREAPGLRLVGLSEEHGRGTHPPEVGVALGDRLSFIPNHACSVVNNFSHAFVVQAGIVVEIYQIHARGALS